MLQTWISCPLFPLPSILHCYRIGIAGHTSYMWSTASAYLQGSYNYPRPVRNKSMWTNSLPLPRFRLLRPPENHLEHSRLAGPPDRHRVPAFEFQRAHSRFEFSFRSRLYAELSVVAVNPDRPFNLIRAMRFPHGSIASAAPASHRARRPAAT